MARELRRPALHALIVTLALSLLAVAAPAAAAEPPAPTVIPRSEWDPAGLCPAGSGDATPPSRVHLHHTHIPVVHAPEEVPEALQAICRFHRGDRGWSDIGYHYLIDPYGRVWQGRGALPSEAGATVIEGSHAQGFNSGGIGIVLIGDFDLAPPTDEALAATIELAGWLSHRYGLDAAASVGAVSGGGSSTRFPEGTHVDLPVVSGHRDTGNGTSCPGEHLYALLPHIREGAVAHAATLAAIAEEAPAPEPAELPVSRSTLGLLRFLFPGLF
jgi:hypothetical protein